MVMTFSFLYSYAYSNGWIEICKNCNALCSHVHACNVFPSMVPKSFFQQSMKTCCVQAPYTIFVYKFYFKMIFSSGSEQIEIHKKCNALLSHVHACPVFFLNGSKIIFPTKHENMLFRGTVYKFRLAISLQNVMFKYK
jgi:hypothetical protein